MRSRSLAIVIASVSLLASVGSGARAAEGMPPIPERTSYTAAREILMKSGYKPVERATAGRCSTLTTICATYPEAVGCATASSGLCRFEWSRGGGAAGAAVIETQGDTPEVLVVLRTFEGIAPASPYPLGVSN